MSRLVFLDTETLGLVPGVHEVWEVALIVRDPGADEKRHHFFLRPQKLDLADPAALRVNRFYERTEHLQGDDLGVTGAPTPAQRWSNKPSAARKIAQITAGATLVGLNVQFDERMLGMFLRNHGCGPAWDYHLIEMRSAAFGYLRGRGGVFNIDTATKSWALSKECGVAAPAPDQAHSAMVDAVWVRDWYDAMFQVGAR